MKGQRYLTRISYKRLLFILGIALAMVMLLSFGAYRYADYQRARTAAAKRQAVSRNIQITGNFWDKMDSIQNYYQTAVQSESVQWMIENEVSLRDYSKYTSAQNLLTMNIQEVTGFALANYRTGWVLGKKGLFTMDQWANRESFEEKIAWQDKSSPKNYWCYQPDGDFSDINSRQYRRIVDFQGLNLILELPLNSYSEYAVLLVNISQATFSRWIQSWLGEYEDIVILENDGSLVYASDEAFLEECVKLQAEQTDVSEPIRKKTDEGVRNVVISSRRSVDTMNWDVFLIYDMEENFIPVENLSGIWFFTLLGVLLLAFVVLAVVIYYPIGSLVRDMAGTENVEGNELSYISDQFQSLSQDKLSLENLVVQQKGRLEELFEYRMIRGEVTGQEWLTYMRELGREPKPFYESLIIVVEENESMEETSNLNEDALCLKIVQSLPEELKGEAWLPPVSHGGNIYAMLAGESIPKLEEKTTVFIRHLTAYIKETFQAGSRVGVSAVHTNYDHIYNSYREGLNALLTQSISGEKYAVEGEEKNCFFYLTDMGAEMAKKGETREYSYEKAVQRSIRSLDEKESCRLTDELMKTLEESSASPEEIVIRVIDYVNAILAAALQMKVDLGDILSGGLEKVYYDIFNGTELAKTGNYIKGRLLEPIFAKRKTYISSQSESITEDVYRLIRENKGDITLYECAEQLKVDEASVWKALKLVSGKAFSELTEEYKLEEARNLLLHTDKKITDIAMELGYSNTQNFIRFFSKKTGMTPGKYRRLN